MSSNVPTGTEFGGFRGLELLGTGSSGAVYLAEDVMLERRVALKSSGPSSAATNGSASASCASRGPQPLEHPNIVPIYAAGEANGALYIAMRFVEGRDLRQLLAGVGPLAPERAVAIMSQVAAALDAAHARGLVHRDVKPGNILLATAAGRSMRIWRTSGWRSSLHRNEPDRRARDRRHDRLHRARAGRGRSG